MRIWITLVACCIISTNYACIDNRYFIPYITSDPYFFSPESSAYLRSSTFCGSSYEAYNTIGNEVPLFEFERDDGVRQYDLREIDRALQQSDRTQASLFPSEWESSLPQSVWCMAGHLEVQGFHCEYTYPVTDWLRLGGSWYWMIVESRLELLDNINADSNRAFGNIGNDQQLFDIKAHSHEALDMTAPLYIETLPGDLELHARFSWNCEYAYTFQYIDLGLQTGLLLPTSEQRDIHNPASVPAGGNNHAGIYVSFNPHMILKDNIRAGWDLRIIKRFATTQSKRMPVANEPIRFGAAVGQADVSPGVTVGFAPYLAFEELREGFGLLFRYSIVGHEKDSWRAINLPDGVNSVDRDTLVCTSSWALEHVSAQAFYDFGYDCADDASSARIYIKGEVPVEWLAAKRAAKMYGMSIALEGSF